MSKKKYISLKEAAEDSRCPYNFKSLHRKVANSRAKTDTKGHVLVQGDPAFMDCLIQVSPRSRIFIDMDSFVKYLESYRGAIA